MGVCAACRETVADYATLCPSCGATLGPVEVERPNSDNGTPPQMLHRSVVTGQGGPISPSSWADLKPWQRRLLVGAVLAVLGVTLWTVTRSGNDTPVSAEPSAERVSDVGSKPSYDSAPASDVHPLDQMAVAFVGGHARDEIQVQMDRAMQLYGLPRTEENYSRAGSVLVTMRKDSGFDEMQILDYMIRSHVPGVNITFPEAAAIAATFLGAGDR